MAQPIDLPPYPNGDDASEYPQGYPSHPPRSAALWLALMALHHLRFDYPSRAYFTGKNLDAALTIAWVEYMKVALVEEV